MSPDLAKVSDQIISNFSIGPEQMQWMKQDAVLMHPLPRVSEIKPNVDSDSRAAYFRQAENGLFVRMALLKWVVGG